MSINQVQRQRLWVAIAIGILSVYALFSLGDVSSATNRLREASEDLAETKLKLSAIDRLSNAPRIASLDLESPAEISRRISAALRQAGLPSSTVMDTTPGQPQRIGQSDFKLRATAIKLAPITLQAFISFCDALHDEETGSVIRDITLSEPSNRLGGATQEKWEIQMTLTQMIFSPKSK